MIGSDWEVNAQDLYEQVYAFLINEIIRPLDWPVLENKVLHYKTLGMSNINFVRDEIVPLLACHAVGACPKKAIPAASAWVLSRIAANIFDSIQDQHSKHAYWFENGRSEAMNYAISLLSCAQIATSHLDLPAQQAQKISKELGFVFANSAYGQTQSVKLEQLCEKQYISMIFNKTGHFVGTGFWIGAEIGSPDTKLPAILYDYGLHIGMMSQIIDDCRDLKEDIKNKDISIPVILALSGSKCQLKRRLIGLLDKKHLNCSEVEESEALVIKLGGLDMAVYTALQYQKKAKCCFSRLPNSVAKPWIGQYVQNCH